jgi:hypothetical protein
MFWKEDEEFTYPNGDTTNLVENLSPAAHASPLIVSWNMDGDDVEISMIEWDDDTGHRHYTGDELWEMDMDLAEDIMSYIENEFIESEDFWMSKSGYDY